MANKSSADFLKEARENLENLTPQQAHEEIQKGNVSVIDLREKDELENGAIPGSTHAPRGLLEFYADEAHSFHKPEFDKNKRIIVHCASGGRSTLASKTLKDMGYTNVANLEGGFTAWKNAGLPVDEKK
jgi:rhodanese-related sulfurtransferase